MLEGVVQDTVTFRWSWWHKGQWRGALMFSLICTRINGGVNNREAGDLGRHRAHYDVIVMVKSKRDALSTELGLFCIKRPNSSALALELVIFWIYAVDLFNISRPEQSGLHLADDILKLFWLKFHRGLLVRVQSTIIQHWYRYCLE